MPQGFSVIPIEGMPEVKEGDDLVALIIESCQKSGTPIQNGDIVILAAKIVSKSEGRFVNLDEVKPSPFSLKAAKTLDKPPAVVEIILRETLRIVKMERDKLIVENLLGVTCANAGVDMSNVGEGNLALLLPEDPDETSRMLHEGIKRTIDKDAAVIVTDTVGRPWRDGLVQIAIGCYGISPMKDYRGGKDRTGFELQATILAQADELSSAAGLLLGKTEGVPVVVIRGYDYEKSAEGARRILRKPEDDLFR